MLGDDVSPEFFDQVSEFIEVANRQNRKWPTSRVSSAILYAAARYNAFNFQVLDSDAAHNTETAVNYYCQQYRAMLLENMTAMRPHPSGDTPDSGATAMPDS